VHRPTLCALALAAGLAGCTTATTSDTKRTAMEQLLISNAVDQSLDKVNFTPFANQRVFLDDKYLDCTDKPYVVSSIRHRLYHSGAFIVDAPTKADIVVEPRAGAIGTDTVNQFVGVPEIAVPGVPLGIPEIQLIKRRSQTATAKIGLVAYTPEDGRNVGQGGLSLARSGDDNWFVFGVGPWQNGSVRTEVARELKSSSPGAKPIPTQVAFGQGLRSVPRSSTMPPAPAPTRGPFEEDPERVRLTGEERGPATSVPNAEGASRPIPQ
jgi:hypothetical protein